MSDERGYTVTPEGRVVVDPRALLESPAVQEVFEIAARIVNYGKQAKEAPVGGLIDEALRERVAELESMIPRWVFRYSEEQEKLDNDGWYECDNTVINGVEYVFMVRDFPVPKEMLIEVKTDEIK